MKIIMSMLLLGGSLAAEKQYTPWDYKLAIIINNLPEGIENLDIADEVSLDIISALISNTPVIISSSIFNAFMNARKNWRSSSDPLEDDKKKLVEEFAQKRFEILKPFQNINIESPKVDAALVKKAEEKIRPLSDELKKKLGDEYEVQTLAIQYICSRMNIYGFKAYVFPTKDWVLLISSDYIEALDAFLKDKQVLEYFKNLEKAYAQSRLTEEKKKVLSYAKGREAIEARNHDILTGLKLSQLKSFDLYELEKSDAHVVPSNKTVNIANLFPYFVKTNEGSIGTWSIYLTGHGTPHHEGISDFQKKGQMLSQLKLMLEDNLKRVQSGAPVREIFINEDIKNNVPGFPVLDIKSPSSEYESKESIQEKLNLFNKEHGVWKKQLDKEYSAIIESSLESNKVQIAGIPAADFQSFLAFCNNRLSVNFMIYSTCFGGGYHLSKPFINKLRNADEKSKKSLDRYLESSPIHFTLMSAATTDIGVATENSGTLTKDFYGTSLQDVFAFLESNGVLIGYGETALPLIRSVINFPLMFSCIDELNYVATSDRKFFDSLECIIRSLNVNFPTDKTLHKSFLTFIPSIRFPGTTFFRVYELGKIADVLTYSRVVAKTLEYKRDKKPLEINKRIVLLYPHFFDFPLNIRTTGAEFPKIISMAPGMGLHYFESITAPADTFEKFIKEGFLVDEEIFGIYGVPKLFIIKKLILAAEGKENEYRDVVIFMWHGIFEENRSKVRAWNKDGQMLESDILSPLVVTKEPPKKKVVIEGILDEWITTAKFYPLIDIGQPGQMTIDALIQEVKKRLSL